MPAPHEPTRQSPSGDGRRWYAGLLAVLRDVTWPDTWPGRILLAAAGVRLAVFVLEALSLSTPALDTIGTIASIALAATGAWLLVRLLIAAKRRLLWRVRRKLILSYIFIGVIPSLLLLAFFLFAAVLNFFHVSAYLLKTGLDDLVEEAQVIAETTALELQRAKGADGMREVLERRRANTADRYNGLSLEVVRREGVRGAGAPAPMVVGPWRHATPPDVVPAWVSVGGFGGLLVAPYPDEPGEMQLVVRAVGVPDTPRPLWAVIVDIPVDARVLEMLRESTGIELTGVDLVQAGDRIRVSGGRMGEEASQIVARQQTGSGSKWTFNSVNFVDTVDWRTGGPVPAVMGTVISLGDIYERLSAAQSRVGDWSLGSLFMAALVAVAVLFLIIELVALVMGFALARSITGSIHQLFMGTERVRRGDFTHRIDIGTRDQLGELAASFNQMTASVEEAIRQEDERKRLQEELRIAREIQMSLLPRGAVDIPGLSITALCVPAREVGGDYYDFFRLGERRLGLLIADVAGKGTSAALYMAELKGLVLSLSQTCESPRQLLVEVNRIISDNLDSRSFITMTYAVIDLDRRTLTYARAGHTPLLYLPSSDGDRPQSRLLAPDGLVVGLRIDGVAARFAQLLEESSIPLAPGDVFVLFTDGVTEAMNQDQDLFGDERLRGIVEEHGHLPSAQLRERILREVEAWVGEADQHDDMTLILIKVEDLGMGAPTSVTAPSVAAMGGR